MFFLSRQNKQIVVEISYDCQVRTEIPFLCQSWVVLDLTSEALCYVFYEVITVDYEDEMVKVVTKNFFKDDDLDDLMF